MYSSRLDKHDPAIGALDRAEDTDIESAALTILERRRRLLRLRQRTMKVSNRRLPDIGDRIPDDVE